MKVSVCMAIVVGTAGVSGVTGGSGAAEARPPATGVREPVAVRPAGGTSTSSAPSPLSPVAPWVAPATSPPVAGGARVPRDFGRRVVMVGPYGVASIGASLGTHINLRVGSMPALAVPIGGLGAGDLLGAAVHGPDFGVGNLPNQPAQDTDGGGFSGPVQLPVRPGFSPTGGGLPIFNPAPSLQALAEGLPDRLPQIEPEVQPGPFAIRSLERLGVYVRSLRVAELRDSTVGRDLVVDLPVSRSAPVRPETAANRLLRSAVLQMVTEYERLFGSVEGEVTGDEAAQIRSSIEAAWKAFGGPDSAAAGGAALRRAVDASAEHRECAAYLDGLARLFEGLRISGLTATELRAARGAVLAPITPPGMSVQQLERLIVAPAS